MSGIEWSPAQKAQRRKITEATPYARLATRYPDLRQYYVQMAKQMGRDPRRPFDMAVSDYCHGNDLLWKKLYGDREKPADWSWKDVELPPAANP